MAGKGQEIGGAASSREIGERRECVEFRGGIGAAEGENWKIGGEIGEAELRELEITKCRDRLTFRRGRGVERGWMGCVWS